MNMHKFNWHIWGDCSRATGFAQFIRFRPTQECLSLTDAIMLDWRDT
jgi:hypothetical protein